MVRRVRHFSRRSALEAGMASLVGGCSGGRPSAQGTGSTGPLANEMPDAMRAADAGTDTGTDAGPALPAQPDTDNVVSLVSLGDVEASVRRAVELAGGLDPIQPGQTVFVKPNAVHGGLGNMPGVVTTTEVVAAVVRLVKERGARVIVGDRSARIAGDSVSIFEAIGLTEAALAAGADEVYPAPTPAEAPDDWVLTPLPSFAETWEAAGGVLLMRRLIEADHVINVPTCKNHEWAVFSASMKNFIGAIGDDSRDPLHYDLGSPEQLSRDIALLNQGFSPLLNIVDARAVMINGGPGGGGSDAIRIQRDMIIAGRDRVAVDAACVALMQLELSRTEVPEPDASNAYLMGLWAWQMPQIVEAIERGLGASAADEVALRFDGIADAAEIDEYFRA